jgi:hypothetical protein
VELKYSVSLEDGISPSAKKASASVERLTLDLSKAKGALSTYQAQLTRAKAIGDVEGYRKYSALVSEARGNVYRLSDALGTAKVEGDGFVGALGAAGLGLVTLGVTAAAAGAAIVGGLVAGLEKVIETALDVTSTNKRLEASFEALGGAGSGAKTLAFVDDLATKLPQSRKEIAGWVSQFQALGITDLGQIREQILATASAQALTFAQGGQGAEVYTKLAERIHIAVEEHKGLKLADKQLKQLYESGLNVTEVAAAYAKETHQAGYSAQRLALELKAGTINAQAFGNALSTTLVDKGKGPLEAMGSDLGVLATKAKETFEHFFDDIDGSPITDALKSVISLGDQGEPSGQALKKGITGALNEIIKWIGSGITEAEIFFLDLEIGALKSGISMQDVRDVLQEITADLKTAAKAAGVLYDVFGDIVGIGATMADSFHDPLDRVKRQLENKPTDVGSLATRDDTGSAPAHAGGGMIGKPARGEVFASVEPGELVIPRRIASLLQSSDVGNDNRDAGGVTINELHLTIQAPQGVTDATHISASGLATALERFQLASGR